MATKESEKEKELHRLINKIEELEDDFEELKAIIKTLNIRVTRHDYELIPISNLLIEKTREMAETFDK